MRAIKWINVQLRGDGCENVDLCGRIKAGGLRRGYPGGCTRPDVAPSPDIDEAATTDKRVYMSGDGAVRRVSRGGYNISVDIEAPKIEEVVRE
jgi:hypothetical protein